MPGPPEFFRSTFTLSRSDSHATNSSALGLIRSPVTEPPVIFGWCWSRAAANKARHGVMRVQARSVLPGEYAEHWRWIARLLPRWTDAASVIRRCASRPSGSVAGASGASHGHHAATGESGSSRGSTTDSQCLTTSPLRRMSAVSPVQPAPVPTCALTCGAPRASPRTTPSTRAGCSWDACRAAAIASGAWSSSTTMTSVITIPIAGLPARIRAATNSAAIPAAFVSISSIMGWPLSWSSPDAAVAGEHGIGGGGTPAAGLVAVGPALARPVGQDRVEDLPRPLHLGMAGEQRRVAEEHVEDQPLVGLGARLGERAAVGEVHVHVADLHRAPRNLGTEADGRALVRLDPEHDRVVGQVLRRRLGEGQVRRPLEHHGHLGDPSAQ